MSPLAISVVSGIAVLPTSACASRSARSAFVARLSEPQREEVEGDQLRRERFGARDTDLWTRVEVHPAVRLARDQQGRGNCLGQGIAGQGVEESAARPGAGHAGHAQLLLPGGKVPASHDGQHAGFMPQQVAMPTVAGTIGVDPARQGAAIKLRAIGVIGILDEQLVMGQRQDIDETIGPVLRHPRVHDHRPGQAVWLGGAQVPPHEHLPATRQLRAGRKAPAVDHGAGLQLGATGQHDAVVPQFVNLGLATDRPGGKLAHQGRGEVARCQRAVWRAKGAPVAGEGHIVAITPARGAHLCQQIRTGRVQIGRKPGPAMVPARLFAGFEQHHVQLGPGPTQRKRDQPAGKAPSGNNNIVATTGHRPRL